MVPLYQGCSILFEVCTNEETLVIGPMGVVPMGEDSEEWRHVERTTLSKEGNYVYRTNPPIDSFVLQRLQFEATNPDLSCASRDPGLRPAALLIHPYYVAVSLMKRPRQ